MAFRVTIALLIQAQVHFADRTVYFRLILLTFLAAVGAPLPDRHDDWQVLWNRGWGRGLKTIAPVGPIVWCIPLPAAVDTHH